MQKSNIKVIVVGIGEMGKRLCCILHKKEGVEIVGAVDINPDLAGKDLGEVCKTGGKSGILIDSDLKKLCLEKKADVALFSTVTTVGEIYNQVLPAIESGMNVISTSEPLSFPWRDSPEYAQKLDETARKHQVSILGTGVCPGLIPDVIPIVASAGCYEVEHIDIEFFGDVFPYGPTVWKGMGLGLDPEEYKLKLGKEVDIDMSAPPLMVAESLGWHVDDVKQENNVLIAPWDIQVGDLFVRKGTVSGFSQTTRCYMKDKEIIRSHVTGPICSDLPPFWVEVAIMGKPAVKLRYELSQENGWTTSTMMVNMIPKIMTARPGLVSMKDMVLPSAIMGDMRKFV